MKRHYFKIALASAVLGLSVGATSLAYADSTAHVESDNAVVDGGEKDPVVKSATVDNEETETVEKVNIIENLAPTTNSQNTMPSENSTIPDLIISHPDAATDGDDSNSNDDEQNTKIIAGKETGEEDNGYSTWQPVYLQYDFKKNEPISEISILRNTYDNAVSTFKNVKVELSTNEEFKENVITVFPEQDIKETVDHKGDPQVIRLEKPVEARYIRIWGKGHFIENTNSNWKGYSNGVLFNEIKVYTDKLKKVPIEKVVNLAALKTPYFYGKSPENIGAINDGKFDENYTVQTSTGSQAYLQYEFKQYYKLKDITFKVKPGLYKYIKVESDYNPKPSAASKVLYLEKNKMIADGVISFNVKTDQPTRYVRFRAEHADGQAVSYAEIEIMGTGKTFDETSTPYKEPQSKYNKLVWSDEFDGKEVDQTKWNIIEGMKNDAAIYNKGAVSIVKDGENSYLSIESRNFPNKDELVKEVGFDNYDGQELPDKVTWSSGRIEAKDKYSFQNGRIAVRAKVNDSKGIWPAIWMLAQDETGHDEIDILEYLGQDAWDIWTTNHFGILGKNKESHGVSHKNYEAWSQNFHVYEVEWSPEYIKWFIDGEPVFTTTRGKDDGRDGMHNRPMFPIIETQVGDGWVGDVDYSKNLTKQTSQFLIDWIRIYQEEGQNQVYFDNLDPKVSIKNYTIRPQSQIGTLNYLSDGNQPYENKNNFYYGGQPRYEKSRLYGASDGENALIYRIQSPTGVHLTTYYKTLEDAKTYDSKAWANRGENISRHLVDKTRTVDFEVYSSIDGDVWEKAKIKKVDNFVEASPAYARVTFDVGNIPKTTNFVKIVFPKLDNQCYKNLGGEIKNILKTDVQLAKVTFTAPKQNVEIVTQTLPAEGVKELEVVKPEVILSVEVIPYQTVEKTNPQLVKGEHRVVTKGQNGERLLIKEVFKDGDKIMKSTDLPSLITKKVINEVVEVGIMEANGPQSLKMKTGKDKNMIFEELGVPIRHSNGPKSYMMTHSDKKLLIAQETSVSMQTLKEREAQLKEVVTSISEEKDFSRVKRAAAKKLPETGSEEVGLLAMGIGMLGLGITSLKRKQNQ